MTAWLARNLMVTGLGRTVCPGSDGDTGQRKGVLSAEFPERGNWPA